MEINNRIPFHLQRPPLDDHGDQVTGHSKSRADSSRDTSRSSRERALWRRAREQVETLVRRRRRNRSDRRPRHGTLYRGRLATLLREFRVLLYRYGSVAATSAKGVSGKTRKDRRIVMTQMLVDLHKGKYQVCHLKNLAVKHVLAILQHWMDKGIACSTMATYVSHLRVLLLWLEKPQLCAAIDQYLAEHPGMTQRRSAAERDKSERGANVKFDEIYHRATATGSEYFVCQLLLIAAFGLRARESWAFRPHLSIDPGGALTINRGTKGGRARKLLAPLTSMQRYALDRARALVPGAHGSMIPPEFGRMEQWSREFYRLCRQIGLTRDQLGVTPHSLRHGVLLDLYERLAGVLPPVRGGVQPPGALGQEREVRQIVAEVAGHSRRQASSAYLGSRRRRKVVEPPALLDGSPAATPSADVSTPSPDVY